MLLVSFCNQMFTPHLCLGVLDTSTGEFRWLDLQRSEYVSGAAGICSSGGYVYVGMQSGGKGPRLHVYEESSFELVAAHDLRCVSDIHSITAWGDDEFLVASTGTDELYLVSMEGPDKIREEVLYWRFPGSMVERGDQCHVNCAVRTEGGVLVSYCNSSRGVPLVDCAYGGGILRIDDGTIVSNDLQGPHSLAIIDGEVAFTHQPGLFSFLGGKTAEVGGYARGLAHEGEEIFVGSSGRRWKSRSTRRNLPLDEKEFIEDGAAVTVLDRRSLEAKRRFDLRPLGREIYDLAVVSTGFDAAHAVGRQAVELRALELERVLYRNELVSNEVAP